MSATPPQPARFVFGRDTFAFRNELVWEYRLEAGTGRMATRRVDPPPSYAHRCFVMVQACRQFHLHARFDPARSPVDDAGLRSQVQSVLRRNPRRASNAQERVVIPGFAGLGEFSRRHEALLKSACGGAWRSYVLRSHWRMVFPISRRHQARQASRLEGGLRTGRLPLIHLVRFPQLTINHGLLLFAVDANGADRTFEAYDPNLADRPAHVSYTAADRTFRMPANHYWPGGQVDVIEIGRTWWF